jgi:hypothetical protein
MFLACLFPVKKNRICNPIKVSDRRRGLASQRLGMAWAFQLLLVSPEKKNQKRKELKWE